MPGALWRRAFPGQVRELRELRRWIDSLLPDCRARDDVLTVTTELAANAIRHTASGQDGSFAVGIARLRGVVRIAVADGGAPSAPRIVDDPDAEYGRGLIIVASLSVQFGQCGDERGRVVWADVAYPADDTAPI
jgi:anti-sigma regulatory factor (Ser/Thr protein kinase)